MADPVGAASLSLVKGSCGFQQESIKVTSMRGTCQGVFLGIALHSNDIMVGKANGSVGLARSFRRLPESQRVDVMLLRGVRGVPWCLDPQVGAEIEVAVPPAPLVREVDLPPDPPPAAAPEPRRVYIRRVELMKHGFTPGCPGCEAAQAGTPPRGHTEPCRVRIETAMRGDKDGGEARVARAENCESGCKWF